jgi:protein-L-isoaspartate(D-aspartate) O-methyltransferase
VRAKNLSGARRRYARKLRHRSHLRNQLLIRAFAEVSREHYLGPGPWKIAARGAYRQTPDAHPRHVYRDVLIGIIPERLLNNGQPSALAQWLDALDLKRDQTVVHIGCGTGYYSAIIAHVVGPGGHLTAIEIDDELAPRAKQNLAHLAQVEMIHGDGSSIDVGPADAIFVNAGANFPESLWLDALKPNGRLLFPLITMKPTRLHVLWPDWARNRAPLFYTAAGAGVMLTITREAAGFSARATSSVGIFPCINSIHRETDQSAAIALRRGDYETIRSIRRDAHQPDDSCWLHNDGACISRATPSSS